MAQDADSATSNVATGVSIPSTVSSASSSSLTQECQTCPPDVGITPMRNSYAAFPLAPGQFLHDVTGYEMTLDRFGKLLCTSSRDGPRCTTSFTKNVPLNRYLDVPCLEENRVILQASNPDYIHANFVDGFRKTKRYICAQSPLQSTIDRFWDMVWQEKAVVIVAMCVPNYYFPLKSGEKSTISSFTVIHQGTTKVRGVYDATVLQVTKGSESRRIVHFEYFDWPRKCTPRQPSEVLALLADVRYNHKLLSKQGEKDKWLKAADTFVIRCSLVVMICGSHPQGPGSIPGIGTTFCRFQDSDCRTLQYGSRNCMIDVADTVTRLRTQRAMAVQKPEEFVFLNLVSLEYAIRKKYFSSEEVAKLHMSNYYLFPEPETGDAPEN
ncbi:hypothetical protein PRIPAC_92982 [Pristionchus pacificus]|uniref:Tyrosine phosphatase n=1 Tax=Pristionchus pacificus TaxID=54126 RepID=A0A2A6BPP8_PRIPA|nr:hypothetical protein PRIPAC_92982 [Pristionchus pacificus]|eukprot:PDM67828.1 tyrosine phosphatase [Pristionchus pacificus]